ncbi:MAG: hypothetical protein MUE95_11000 [Cyclobacteriaceae bacterium]|jgi:hypothetical protein|nr:hypothetical protein [Cyclobacteriaceae bacterium]
MKTSGEFDKNKTSIFSVPDGYFEQLPLKIQQRIEAQQESKRSFRWLEQHRFYYATTALALGILAFVLFLPDRERSAESLLNSVDTEQLIAYLEDTNLTTDELLETFEFSAIEVQSIEDEAFLNFVTDENILDQSDVEWGLIVE